MLGIIEIVKASIDACGRIIVEKILSCCHPNTSPPKEEGARDQTQAGQSSRSLMVNAKSLYIEHSEKKENWDWFEDESGTGFGEVAKALSVAWLIIEASINFARLSADTNYAAYLIYKTTAESQGLDALLEATVSAGNHQSRQDVCIKPSAANLRNKKRSDGWMELELGHFNSDDGTGKVDISLKDTKKWKKGLIVAGIEVRPT